MPVLTRHSGAGFRSISGPLSLITKAIGGDKTVLAIEIKPEQRHLSKAHPRPPMLLFFNSTLPRYQSKPRALESISRTSINLASMVIWGGAMFNIWIACSIRSKSAIVALTNNTPLRSFQNSVAGGVRVTPAAAKKALTISWTAVWVFVRVTPVIPMLWLF